MIIMNNKVLFDVKLPATGRHYDFWVPEDMAMGEVSSLICEAMQNIEPDFFANTGRSTLMYLPTGEIQNPSATVNEIGFTNGDQFVLV